MGAGRRAWLSSACGLQRSSWAHAHSWVWRRRAATCLHLIGWVTRDGVGGCSACGLCSPLAVHERHGRRMRVRTPRAPARPCVCVHGARRHGVRGPASRPASPALAQLAVYGCRLHRCARLCLHGCGSACTCTCPTRRYRCTTSVTRVWLQPHALRTQVAHGSVRLAPPGRARCPGRGVGCGISGCCRRLTKPLDHHRHGAGTLLLREVRVVPAAMARPTAAPTAISCTRSCRAAADALRAVRARDEQVRQVAQAAERLARRGGEHHLACVPQLLQQPPAGRHHGAAVVRQRHQVAHRQHRVVPLLELKRAQVGQRRE
mmetsp:Transcript_22226/g.56487  ORF Transcript_22226/g.56487 Transcript_22226/m.56487 type:complete len:318 (-) Transcript_22226:4011-4964(-)